jgi:hypothetical protein
MDIEQPSSLRWLLEVRPQLDEAEAPVEFVQGAGETVFVPGGWWHMVLNLEVGAAAAVTVVQSSLCMLVILKIVYVYVFGLIYLCCVWFSATAFFPPR